MKKFAIAVLALAILAVGMAMADRPVNQTPETQGISTTTDVSVMGTLTNAESITWVMSDQDTRAASLSAEEVQYTMAYTQSVQAEQGIATFTAQNDLDTQNKVANTKNFATTKTLEYTQIEDGYGRATTTEVLTVDGAGMNTSSSDKFLCPFAIAATGTIPRFCNIIEVGSSFTGSGVSMTTIASERHVAKSSDVPVSVDYNIDLNGQGTASAYYKAHFQEARGTNTDKALDIVATEKTTASGYIPIFTKDIKYQSGVRRY